MSLYNLKILTPEKKIFNDEVSSITVTSKHGLLTVLARHAPMVAALAEGPIVVKTKNETITGRAGNGILQVARNECAVMVHSFKWNNDELTKVTDEEMDVINDML